jgi:uncharacterized protein YkwD
MYRIRHKAGSLVVNSTINDISQIYSCKMADTFDFSHNDERNDQGAGPLGENIYFEGQSNKLDIIDSACECK